MAKDIARTVLGMDLLQGVSRRYIQAAGREAIRERYPGRAPLYKGHRSKVIVLWMTHSPRPDSSCEVGAELRDKWSQAQKDAATVAAVGAWIYDLQFQNSNRSDHSDQERLSLWAGLNTKQPYRGGLEGGARLESRSWQSLRESGFYRYADNAKPSSACPSSWHGTIEARALALQNTQAVNFAGIPALAIPVPMRDGNVHVTSLQLIGPRLAEADLLNAGRLVENAVNR